MRLPQNKINFIEKPFYFTIENDDVEDLYSFSTYTFLQTILEPLVEGKYKQEQDGRKLNGNPLSLVDKIIFHHLMPPSPQQELTHEDKLRRLKIKLFNHINGGNKFNQAFMKGFLPFVNEDKLKSIAYSNTLTEIGIFITLIETFPCKTFLDQILKHFHTDDRKVENILKNKYPEMLELPPVPSVTV